MPIGPAPIHYTVHLEVITAMGTEFIDNEIVMIVVLVLMTAVGAVVGWWLR